MCPACITSMVLVVAGGTSAGGLTAVVMKKLRANTGAKSNDPATKISGGQDGSSKSRVAS
jgi:hypothetical protein